LTKVSCFRDQGASKMTDLDFTHDPSRKSWVATANSPTTDFPIQNLPFCMFARPGEVKRAGVAIGDEILDLTAAADLGLLDGDMVATVRACTDAGLNPLMATAGPKATALRCHLSELLLAGNTAAASPDQLLVAQREVTFYLPAEIGGFTDFFTSVYHTERTGRPTRPENPVPPKFPLHADRLQQPRQFGAHQW
jgi:fumarylacetoacetase